MEFVVVRCSDDADLPVYVDAQNNGRTSQVLDVSAGIHTFALCTCSETGHQGACKAATYRPVSQTLRVTRTVAIDPLEIRFDRA